MTSPTGFLALSISGLFAFALTWTGQEIAEDFSKPSASLQPAIAINEIQIFADGSVIYDGKILTEEVWQAWSGTVFFEDTDEVHCKGGDLARYIDDFRYTDWDADYMVGASCVDGLQEGMRWVFTWTPVGPDYAPVRYPEKGYGVVLPASVTELDK